MNKTTMASVKLIPFGRAARSACSVDPEHAWQRAALAPLTFIIRREGQCHTPTLAKRQTLPP